ncbi:MAG: hypothetical protein ABI833_15645 [Acidobacteriota bacterium]
MKSSLRPTSVDDLDALRQFLARAFGLGLEAPFLDRATLAWKYWERRDDWTGPRGYILERDGAIVAHAGIWPMTFNAGAIRGVQMIDWASDKEAPGAGLALVQKMSAMFDFMYSIGGSEMTCKVLPAFGFVEYAQEWKGVRPLRPVQQILTHQTRTWKLVPRLVRNSMWAMPQGVSPHKSWKALEILPEEVSLEFCPPSAAAANFSPRPPAFFEYLLRCPVARFRLYGILDEGEAKGHFAVGVVRGQARIAGVWLRQPTCEAWTAAYLLAQQTAMRMKEACEIVAVGSEGPSRLGAVQAGFRILQGPVVYMLDKKKKLSLSPEFQFQLSDDDGAFLDTGATAYWS